MVVGGGLRRWVHGEPRSPGKKKGVAEEYAGDGAWSAFLLAKCGEDGH